MENCLNKMLIFCKIIFFGSDSCALHFIFSTSNLFLHRVYCHFIYVRTNPHNTHKKNIQREWNEKKDEITNLIQYNRFVSLLLISQCLLWETSESNNNNHSDNQQKKTMKINKINNGRAKKKQTTIFIYKYKWIKWGK